MSNQNLSSGFTTIQNKYQKDNHFKTEDLRSIVFEVIGPLRLFIYSCGTKPPWWRARTDALGEDIQRAHIT